MHTIKQIEILSKVGVCVVFDSTLRIVIYTYF